jgi:hypothetical protein
VYILLFFSFDQLAKSVLRSRGEMVSKNVHKLFDFYIIILIVKIYSLIRLVIQRVRSGATHVLHFCEVGGELLVVC